MAVLGLLVPLREGFWDHLSGGLWPPWTLKTPQFPCKARYPFLADQETWLAGLRRSL